MSGCGMRQLGVWDNQVICIATRPPPLLHYTFYTVPLKQAVQWREILAHYYTKSGNSGAASMASLVPR